MADDSPNLPIESTGVDPLPVPGLPADWDRQATERIVAAVDQVRIKSAGPAITVARAAVFGLLGAVLAVIAGIILLIGIVRALNNFIPKDVWLVYLILGALFMLAGAFFWSRRPRNAAS